MTMMVSGWHSEMIEKIRRLDQKCEFEPFSTPRETCYKLVKASMDIDEIDLEWCSEMIEKIRRLDEKCKFEPFSTPRTPVKKEASSYQVPELITTQGSKSSENSNKNPEMITNIQGSKSSENIDYYLDSAVKKASRDFLSEEIARAQSMSIPIPPHVDDSISSRKYNSLNSAKEGSSSSKLFESQEGIDVADISNKISTSTLSTSQSYTSENFEYFKSTQKASEQLLQALTDERSYVIGLYGKEGSGKTSLVKAEKFKYREIFNRVLFVTVTGNIVDIRNLHGQIASQLNLSSGENISDLDRSNEIKSILENEKKVLVIFDDVSTILMFDPRNIGIPNPSKQCKLLWIRREKKILTWRKCHPLILLSPLSKEDAWEFLKQYSDIDDDDDDDSSQDELVKVAREVAARCKGLPGLIEKVVSSLVRKEIKDWRELLDSLKHSDARHQIFISFRGTDTRDNITYYLARALIKEGFKVFKDDEQVRSGDEVSESLTNAIKQTRLSIVILSENFAQSSWCLGELVQILQCRKDMKQRVLPVFYKVDPSDIRYVKGSFGKGMEGKEKRFGTEKVQQWTGALKEIADLSGKHYMSGPEYEFIQTIVDHVKQNKHCLYII
ncbi:probable disease resistance protein At1g52660 [Lotus japonicus]|uniref:probable disease resistance protein At1g52660 n=1 Tax=Lotus japonicus TaxID=34305 RepID=UPI002584DDB7|nr:probable disease resistance protein At1g52660 [Lotus japonicus]